MVKTKLLEYKVKKGNLKELLFRMDIILLLCFSASSKRKWLNFKICTGGKCYFWPMDMSGQGIAPLDRESNKVIRRNFHLRASVKVYQNNLNTHKSYSKFRQKRSSLRDKNKKIKGLELTETLNNYAQTGSEYTKKLNQIIKQNRLMDFEPVKLVNSVKKIELSS